MRVRVSGFMRDVRFDASGLTSGTINLRNALRNSAALALLYYIFYLAEIIIDNSVKSYTAYPEIVNVQPLSEIHNLFFRGEKSSEKRDRSCVFFKGFKYYVHMYTTIRWVSIIFRCSV